VFDRLLAIKDESFYDALHDMTRSDYRHLTTPLDS
jgi:hypothetical protein